MSSQVLLPSVERWRSQNCTHVRSLTSSTIDKIRHHLSTPEVHHLLSSLKRLFPSLAKIFLILHYLLHHFSPSTLHLETLTRILNRTYRLPHRGFLVHLT